MVNLAASVRQRLLNLSREQGRPFQEILHFYVMERFLYRLSQSEHADPFAAGKQQQWTAFVRRLGSDVPTEPDFASVLATLEQFLSETLVPPDGRVEDLHWPPGGPWQSGETRT